MGLGGGRAGLGLPLAGAAPGERHFPSSHGLGVLPRAGSRPCALWESRDAGDTLQTAETQPGDARVRPGGLQSPDATLHPAPAALQSLLATSVEQIQAVSPVGRAAQGSEPPFCPEPRSPGSVQPPGIAGDGHSGGEVPASLRGRKCGIITRRGEESICYYAVWSDLG